MPVIHSREILSSRLGYLRGLSGDYAFVVGSGLTAPRVPGVSEALRWMQAELGGGSEARAAFDAAVSNKAGGEQYQAAAEILLGLRGQQALNMTVRSMVLNAHKPSINGLASGQLTADDFDEDYCVAAERDLHDWIVPGAVQSLASLLLSRLTDHDGLVLTTNFDPLVELAVRRAGGTAITKIFDADGRLEDVATDGAIVVAHLHGFWRRDDTAHVPAQLQHERTGLQASLEGILRERTTIVAGYGGWDDAFTSALVAAIRRHGAGDLDVLWTFHSDDEDQLSSRHANLFASVGFVPGRVTFYRGVDCESLFDTIAGVRPADAEDAGVGPLAADDFRSPLEGFTALTSTLLADQESVGESDLVRFFDGQVPTWRTALSPDVPLLGPAVKALDLLAAEKKPDTLEVVLLEGPAGEGKSTALRQVAAACAAGGGWRVLWREADVQGHIDVSGLPQGDRPWLLVIDDADVVGKECLEALRILHERGRSDVAFLLATRTTDWRAGRNPARPWSSYAQFITIPVEGLDDRDASAIVEAWSTAGERGLGDLARIHEPARRSEALLRAAQEEAAGSEGCFFGAMLRVRFGDGLTDHVRTLGERLEGIGLDSGATLLQAFLCVACVHAHGVTTLRPEALAAALGIPRSRMYGDVIWPLGEEAALTHAGSHLMVRHRSIAEAAVRLADDWGQDIAEIYYDILKGTVRTFREGIYIPDLADIVFISRRLRSNPRVALRAAEAPFDEEPEKLNFRTNLCSALRRADRAREGMELARRTYYELDSMVDPQGERSLLYEWAVCAGRAGDGTLNAYLAIWSLADRPTPEAQRLNQLHFEKALSGLSESLDVMARASDDPWPIDAKAVVMEIRSRLAGKIDDAEDLSQPIGKFKELADRLEGAAREADPDVAIPHVPMAFAQVKKILEEAVRVPSVSRGSPS
ncbi:MAG TPA: SIR2 family protein [Solirubrobacterales bacterium]